MSHYERHSKNYDGKGFKYNGNAVMDTAWISKQIKKTTTEQRYKKQSANHIDNIHS